MVSVGSGYPSNTEEAAAANTSSATNSSGGKTTLRDLTNVVIDQFYNSMDSERTWRTFYAQHSLDKAKLIRLNTKLLPPIAELHEVDKIKGVEAEVQRIWTSEAEKIQLLDRLACMLIAAAFFLTVSRTETLESEYICHGVYFPLHSPSF
jgi:hypothetical protein